MTPRYTDLTELVSVYTNVQANSATWNGLQVLAPAPTYIAPTASITNFPSSSLELGTALSQGITLNWTQNDAGTLASGVIRRNGTIVVSPFGSLPQVYGVTEAVTLDTITYQLSVNHNQGVLKNNILNIPDSRGRINAGSVTTSQSYTGYYRYFYGSVATVPTNLRTLPSSVLGPGNSIPTFTADQVNIVIVIPITKVLQSVITQTLENITNNFFQIPVTVNDAGGTGRSYRRYIATTVTPLNIPITTITLADAP